MGGTQLVSLYVFTYIHTGGREYTHVSGLRKGRSGKSAGGAAWRQGARCWRGYALRLLAVVWVWG